MSDGGYVSKYDTYPMEDRFHYMEDVFGQYSEKQREAFALPTPEEVEGAVARAITWDNPEDIVQAYRYAQELEGTPRGEAIMDAIFGELSSPHAVENGMDNFGKYLAPDRF